MALREDNKLLGLTRQVNAMEDDPSVGSSGNLSKITRRPSGSTMAASTMAGSTMDSSFQAKKLNKGLKRYHRRVLSFMLLAFSSASAIGIFALVAKTTLDRSHIVSDNFISESGAFPDFAISSGIKPSELHFNRLSDSQKRQIASKVHFLSSHIASYKRTPQVTTKPLALKVFTESFRAGVDPLLISAIVQTESSFKSSAISPRFAYGLMQVQPATGQFIARKLGEVWRGGEVLLSDENYNLRLGIEYLKFLRRRYDGDLNLALMAYNWGPGNVDQVKAGRRNPPSMVVKYVQAVRNRHQQLHLDFSDARSSYAYMNANYLPNNLWGSLVSGQTKLSNG